MTLGQKIIQLRKERGISQKELANQLGITATRLNYWEKDKRDPSIPMLNLISETLNVDVNCLLGRESVENENKSTEKEETLIKKYRTLDGYGKQAVDTILDIEYKRALEAQKQSSQQDLVPETPVLFYPVPEYSEPASAGTGKPIDVVYPENIMLIKEPPRGTSFIAHVKGESMEPTFQDGDMVFVHAQNEIREGQIGIFFMDGQEFIKELGDGELISHNPNFDCIEIDESVRCQGLVLGICDESYLED